MEHEETRLKRKFCGVYVHTSLSSASVRALSAAVTRSTNLKGSSALKCTWILHPLICHIQCKLSVKYGSISWKKSFTWTIISLNFHSISCYYMYRGSLDEKCVPIDICSKEENVLIIQQWIKTWILQALRIYPNQNLPNWHFEFLFLHNPAEIVQVTSATVSVHNTIHTLWLRKCKRVLPW